MNTYKFSGEIQLVDGKKKFIPTHGKLWLHRLSQCKIGQKAEIHFREIKQIRSLKTNALYWVYLDVIANETGNEVEEMHTFFKRKFLPHKESMIFGEKVYRLTSTTELSNDEFSDYLFKIQDLTRVPIPDTKIYKDEIDSAPLL